MLTPTDSAASFEYQRSVVASVIELLESCQARVPAQPAVFVWSGEAQRAYAEGLAVLREELWHLHALLTDAHCRLGAACA